MNTERTIRAMIGRRPEQDLWRALQDVASSGAALSDGTIGLLDSRMQGFLFLQDHVGNRKARIAFARARGHMPYLRDAAGSRNVWMSDAEFGELVEQDDAETLACFARSEQMAPHHLAYIEYKLALDPHGQDALASAYDAKITAMKAVERSGPTRGMALMRLARAALTGSPEVGAGLAGRLRRSVAIAADQPRALWRAYLNLKSLDGETLRDLLAAAGSSDGPLKTSGQGAASLH